MKSTKIVIAALAVAGLTLSLAACADGGSGGGSPAPAGINYATDVGIVLSDASQPRWVMAEAQFKQQMAGAQIKFSNNDTAVEATNVDAFIAAGVKVIVYNSIDGAAAAAATNKAAAAGIPVIAYDRLIMNTDKVKYYATFDSIAVGAAQGGYLADQAKANGGKGLNLYLFAGDVGDNNAFLFFQGAWSKLQPLIADGTLTVINSAPAVKYKDQAELTRDQMNEIMQPITTLWNPDKAKQLAESAIAQASAAQKGTIFVLAPNDQTSTAMTDAFRADPAVTQVFSTGQDLAKASVQYILDGKQSMTVFKSDKDLVGQTKTLVDSVLKGDASAPSIITTAYNNKTADVPSTAAPIITVTKDNIEQVVNDSGLYTITNGTVADKK